MPRNFRLNSLRAILLVIALALLGCSLASLLPRPSDWLATKADVIAEYGQPNRMRNFILPAGPLFGPLEGLEDIVPAGSVIEEWVYEDGDDLFYVWFAGGEGVAPENWRVITIASYPEDAVY